MSQVYKDQVVFVIDKPLCVCVLLQLTLTTKLTCVISRSLYANDNTRVQYLVIMEGFLV